MAIKRKRPLKKRQLKSGTPKTARGVPRIELFLKRINQEMIRGPGTLAGCDFFVSWKKSCCVLDFSLVGTGDKRSRPAEGFLIRKEPDGGMIWNPRTGTVSKLNEVAYHAILDIENGLSALQVANRNGLSVGSVRRFVGKLQRMV